MAKKKKSVRTRRRERKNVVTGQAHIQSTFNNTIVSITDVTGNVVAWGSAGGQGFKGSRKSTPYAAQQTAEHPLPAGHRARGDGDHRRHADPAQRLPPTQEETRLVAPLDRPLSLSGPGGRSAPAAPGRRQLVRALGHAPTGVLPRVLVASLASTADAADRRRPFEGHHFG